MNSGVGDAIDLSWKLAATLQGWGARAARLVRVRAAGSRPSATSAPRATLRFGGASGTRNTGRTFARPTPEGASTRENLVRVASVEQPKSNEMIGASSATATRRFPIRVHIPGGPVHRFRVYEPSNVAGARLPHVWLGRPHANAGPHSVRGLHAAALRPHERRHLSV